MPFCHVQRTVLRRECFPCGLRENSDSLAHTELDKKGGRRDNGSRRLGGIGKTRMWERRLTIVWSQCQAHPNLLQRKICGRLAQPVMHASRVPSKSATGNSTHYLRSNVCMSGAQRRLHTKHGKLFHSTLRISGCKWGLYTQFDTLFTQHPKDFGCPASALHTVGLAIYAVIPPFDPSRTATLPLLLAFRPRMFFCLPLRSSLKNPLPPILPRRSYLHV